MSGSSDHVRRFERINFLAASTPEAEHARARLVGRYGDVHSGEADVVVALGGDGLMLQTLHKFMGRNMPIYGMNRGSVGFLMNEFRETGLRKRLEAAQSSIIHPLRMVAENRAGEIRRRPMRSTRCRCCARAPRRPSCASMSTAMSGWRNWSPTACSSPRRPDRPPIISPPTARSCRSTRR